MPDSTNDILASFCSKIEEETEKRVRDGLERHLRIDPNVDYDRAVDVLISDEMEELERLYEQHQGGGNNLLAEFYRLLIEDKLPDLANRLKARG